MPESLATFLVGFLGLYLGGGLVVSLGLQIRGLHRIDPATAGASRGFRLIILPAMVALWPLLLRRALRGGGPPAEHNAHRDAATRP